MKKPKTPPDKIAAMITALTATPSCTAEEDQAFTSAFRERVRHINEAFDLVRELDRRKNAAHQRIHDAQCEIAMLTEMRNHLAPCLFLAPYDTNSNKETPQ